MFKSILNTFLCSYKGCRKIRRKNLKLVLWPLQQQNVFQNIRFCSNTGISNLLDKNILEKYFNFIQKNTSYLESLISENDPQYEIAKTLLLEKETLETELNNIKNLKTEKDKEFQKMAEEEEETLVHNIQNIENRFLELLISNDNDDDKKTCEVELQVIPAVGGNEAKLFAEELYNMYLNYALYKNWEILSSELRGSKFQLRSAYLLINADSALKYLIHEAGIHRVQRIPETEKSGRTHTSTCCVAVLPKSSIKDIEIKPNDIIIDKLRSSGPGGQNVNKTETCVQIKHIPTGLRVECQTSRSQSQNLQEALNKLKIKLRENLEQKAQAEKTTLFKEQTKTGDYSDKIRTYNFNQNRITDHRINFSLYNIKEFLLGNKDLDLMIGKVAEFEKKEKTLKKIMKVLNSMEYKQFEKSQLKQL